MSKMNTNVSPFSLLYPPSHPEKAFVDSTDETDEAQAADLSFISDLAVESIFGALRSAGRFRPNQKHPMTYFTVDNNVITYRLDIVEDIYNHEKLYQMLAELAPGLDDMQQVFMAREVSDDTTLAIYSVTEIELYITCMEKLFDFFSKEGNRFKSAGLKNLAAEVQRIHEGEEYQTLKAQTEKVNRSIRNIRSITIGINLDAQLQPTEAGLVSINTESYRSGDIIDKLLRVDLSKDEFDCLAPLQMVSKGLPYDQSRRFNAAVNSTLNTVLKSTLRSWQPAVRRYTSAQSRFLVQLADEIRFLLGGVSLMRRIEERGLPLCKPKAEAKEKRTCTIRGLYNPVVALNLEEGDHHFIVGNDFQFDQDGMIYILTGPNQGGKTVFTQAIGIAQLMFQLGFYVPGREALMSPVDNIYTHFQKNEYGQMSHGRFGEECKRLMSTFEQLTPYSMLLMDETFSSTSAAEASHIAEQVIVGLSALGCRVVFATHLHELAHNLDQLNQNPAATHRIDHLSAGVEENTDMPGKRNFKVTRGRPQGTSYAKDIAEKYGLTLDHMLAAIQQQYKNVQ